MAARVEVIYFPKRTRPQRRGTREAAALDPSSTRTIEFQPAFDGPEPPPQPAPQRDVKRRGRKDRRRPTQEPEADPGLRFEVQKLDELLRSTSPTEPLRTLTRRELADIAAFGHQLFEAGRLQEARRVFEGLVGLDDADAFAHTMLGTVYLALGLQDRALALFESALGIDPAELAARVYRAEIRINLGRTSAARHDLARVVRDGDPDDPFVERAKRLQQILARRQKRRRTPRK